MLKTFKMIIYIIALLQVFIRCARDFESSFESESELSSWSHSMCVRANYRKTLFKDTD